MTSSLLLVFPCDRVVWENMFQNGLVLLSGTLQEEGIEPSEELLERLRNEESIHPSSNLVNDGVILPHETRQVA